VPTDRYSRPIVTLSPCAANGARVLLATITFLGERADITGPDAAMLVGGRRGNTDVLSCPPSAVDDLSGRAHQVTRRAVS